jgi:hypothetical protein
MSLNARLPAGVRTETSIPVWASRLLMLLQPFSPAMDVPRRALNRCAKRFMRRLLAAAASEAFTCACAKSMGGSMKFVSRRFGALVAGMSLLVATNPALAGCAVGDLPGDWWLYATVLSDPSPFTVRCPVTISISSQSPPTYSMIGSGNTCKIDSPSSSGDLQIAGMGSLKETPTCAFRGSFVLGVSNIIIGTVDILDARVESDGSNTIKTHISGIGRQKGQSSNNIWNFSLVR